MNKRRPESIIEYIREATRTVEDQLRLEDTGWIALGGAATGEVITDEARIVNMNLSRLYYVKDPLGHQAIRLWTDYTFGIGITLHSDEENTEKVRKGFWDSKANHSVLSARGQRKSSDKLLIDGEVFFAIFLGKDSTIRWIDPLEITQILTNPEDVEDVKLYKREWTDAASKSHTAYYRDWTNEKGDKVGEIGHDKEALIYHLTYNSISQRGNPLLLPALDWIRQYRRFLASRIAVMLALARFAWRTKVKGGPAVVSALKAKTHEKDIAAGSQLWENFGSDTTPIKTESGAAAAYQDGRMIKHQIFSAVGIPEQYFGDISAGNWATAKTVELPMFKMFNSYQAVWTDVYKDINEIILAHNEIDENKWAIDIDFPPVAPLDVAESSEALVKILGLFPEFAGSEDIKQLALLVLGINNTADVIDGLAKTAESNPEIALLRVIRKLQESLKGG